MDFDDQNDQDELSRLMEEPPGGHNHGSIRREDGGPPRGLSTEAAQSIEFLGGANAGWRMIDVDAGGGHEGPSQAGMVAHRGVIQPGEYVHHERLLTALEEELGFTVETVREVLGRGVRGGPCPIALRETRDALDARVLALSRAGANMDLLRSLLGLTHLTMRRAVARARAAEGTDREPG